MAIDIKSLNEDFYELINSQNGCEYVDEINNQFQLGKTPDGLNMLHLNIRSLHKNIDLLVLLLNEFHECGIVVHLIGLCETFLTDINKTLVDIENYTAFHSVRNDRVGGEISLYIHDFVKMINQGPMPFEDSFESNSVGVNYNRKVDFLANFTVLQILMTLYL